MVGTAMDDLIRHELFEVGVLDRLKRAGLLERLIFGGGTMLRLCHDMQRYSVDLDFWLRPGARSDVYYRRLHHALTQAFEVTDSHRKFFTLLFELRAPGYPRRLKLEIRRRMPRCDTEETIAFSSHGTTQVLVTGMTLAQMMRNKVAALLARREIRDAFDLEFLLRRGVAIEASVAQLRRMAQVLQGFRPQDYRVTLGSLLEPITRAYYQTHQFTYLAERIQARLTAS